MLTDFEQYKEIVGTVASIVTIIQFLSGTVVCLKYIQMRTTGDTSGFSFVCGFLSCNLWLRYGLLRDDSLVFFVNAVGCTLFLSYVFVYYRFTSKKSPVLLQFLCICGILFVFHFCISQEHDLESAIKKTGFISCVVTLIFIASPLTLLLHVIRVKSTDSLPFPLILTSFFVCTLWFVYGVLLGDKFMQIPNALGSLLALFQLSLFIYFPSTSNNQQIPYVKIRQNV